MSTVLDWIHSNIEKGSKKNQPELELCFRSGRWNLVNPETHVAEISMSGPELDRFIGKHIEPFDTLPYPIHCFNGTIPPPE